MTVREVLARVLRDAGATPVQTRLTPSEVARRARQRRRASLALRTVTATAGTAVLVVGGVMVPMTLMSSEPDQPPVTLDGSSAPSTSGDSTTSQPEEEKSPETTEPRTGEPSASAPAPEDSETAPPEPESDPPRTPSDEESQSPPVTTMLSWGNSAEYGDGSATPGNPAELVGIRAGAHPEEGFDRVVFDFADAAALPEYEVRYLESGEQLTQPGSGKPVQIQGVWVLEVTFTETTYGDMESTTLTPGLPSVQEVKYVGGFEQAHTAAVGVPWGDDGAGAPQFRVQTYDNSVVIDIARPSTAS